MLSNFILINGGIRGVQAVGSVLGPVMAAVAGPLAAWYVAQWTIDDYKDFLDNRVDQARDVYAAPAQNVYQDLVGIFQNVNWDLFENSDLVFILQDEVESSLNQYENPYWDKWISELKTRARLFISNFVGTEGAGRRRIAQDQNWTVAVAWQEWYPEDEMVNDIIYLRRTGGAISVLTTFVDFISSPFR